MNIEKLLDGIKRIKIGLITATIDGERIFPYMEEAQKIIAKQQWIPVADRLPEKIESAASAADGEYFRRLEIAVQTDTIEYFIGCFDGVKWFDERYRSFKGDVVAWKVHQPYQQGQETRGDFKEERQND